MRPKFFALPTDQVTAIRDTRRDAYGNPVEVAVSNGDDAPCRHCLQWVPKGERYLVLAHRPFEGQNPYAETGPVFVCEKNCARAEPSDARPATLAAEKYLVRGYSTSERIVYGTGEVTPSEGIMDYAETLLARDDIAFVDVRSASNNCYHCRIKPSEVS